MEPSYFITKVHGLKFIIAQNIWHDNRPVYLIVPFTAHYEWPFTCFSVRYLPEAVRVRNDKHSEPWFLISAVRKRNPRSSSNFNVRNTSGWLWVNKKLCRTKPQSEWITQWRVQDFPYRGMPNKNWTKRGAGIRGSPLGSVTCRYLRSDSLIFVTNLPMILQSQGWHWQIWDYPTFQFPFLFFLFDW